MAKPRILSRIRAKSKNMKSVDHTFVLIVMVLLSFGLIMVFSASSASAHYRMGDTFYFIKRQAIWAVVGIFMMWLLSRIDYKVYYRFATPLLMGVIVLLIAVLTPLGVEVNGAQRWLGFGSFTFQPSELAKFALVIYLAKGLSQNAEKLQKSWRVFVFYMCVIGFVAGIVILEPHMSGAVLIMAVGITMLFVAGAKISHISVLGIAVVVLGIILAVAAPYRMERLMSFRDPFADASDTGFQVVQSFFAIGSGGFFGLGLGQSRQKFLYLPEPQNDFIFSIICEELGFFGALFVVILFAILIWRGICIALKAPDAFSSLLVIGIIAIIGIQAVLNIAVVTGSIPNTGIPLPFFSYGGTSLMIIMSGMGIVLNVTRHIKK